MLKFQDFGPKLGSQSRERGRERERERAGERGREREREAGREGARWCLRYLCRAHNIELYGERSVRFEFAGITLTSNSLRPRALNPENCFRNHRAAESKFCFLMLFIGTYTSQSSTEWPVIFKRVSASKGSS